MCVCVCLSSKPDVSLYIHFCSPTYFVYHLFVTVISSTRSDVDLTDDAFAKLISKCTLYFILLLSKCNRVLLASSPFAIHITIRSHLLS